MTHSEQPGPDIAIVDYGWGSRERVRQHLAYIDAEPVITDRPDEIAAADGLVLPGQGAFPTAMRELQVRDLLGPLEEFRASGKPILGICLGEQLLFESSSEHEHTDGLGWLPGEVHPVPSMSYGINIGPRPVTWHRESPLTVGIESGDFFHHAHSYAAQPSDERVILGTSRAEVNSPIPFVTAVQSGNVYGTQFHPEVSWSAGRQMMINFREMCRNVAETDTVY